MPGAHRERRAQEGDDLCWIAPGDGDEMARFFLRVVLPVRLTDRDHFTQWGLWVEVLEGDARRVWELWEAPDQAQAPPFDGFIANQVSGYPDTIGLPVRVKLTGPTTRPRAWFENSVQHPFAAECRAGVATHRVVDWLAGQGCAE